MPDHPDMMTLSEFAEHIGRHASWISHLRAAGRLVMTDDGRVRVAESLRLIEETRGNRPDVSERNAEARAAEAADLDPNSERRRARAEAELRIKRAEADRAELARDREAGEVVLLADATYTVRDLASRVRERVELVADRLAPELVAVSDPDEARRIIAAECNAVLRDVAAAVAKAEKAVRSA